MMKNLLTLIVVALLASATTAEDRVWTDATGGHTVEAEFSGLNDGKVILKRVDGQTFAMPLEGFSRADQEYVRKEVERRRAALKVEVSDKPGTVLYGPGKQLCALANSMIDESSGLACSRSRPGLFWTHNDSGDLARLYALDRQGKDLGWCDLKDVQAFDFEDVASFSRDGKHYLLVGDTGNNGLAATIQILYLIEEPPIDADKGVSLAETPIVQVINYSYEDDHRNCEALAIDPSDRTILLVTKERESKCLVYALVWPKNDPKQATSAKKIATLKIPLVTAMDVSPDGRRAVVLTYGNAYEYTRGEKETWATAFSRRPALIRVPERVQGESICYGPDGKTLYLTSEKLPTPLIEVPVK
ncbi:MAG: hypothetical protein HQ567_25015 [Candidatus Nealsonbacteria bacterium]|nr:hypothetical protein [Candidatus Nealsonbacteria bacterium]